jgi:hypothetical protein
MTHKLNEVSLQLLLILYQYAVQKRRSLDNLIIEFRTRDWEYFTLNETYINTKEVFESFRKFLKEENDNLLKLALEYLHDEDLLIFKSRSDSGSVAMLQPRLTSNGIKTIEGVSDEKYKKVVENHFHISLVENATVESLLESKVGFLNL